MRATRRQERILGHERVAGILTAGESSKFLQSDNYLQKHQKQHPALL